MLLRKRVSVTSPSKLLNELFTTEGDGTLFKWRENFNSSSQNCDGGKSNTIKAIGKKTNKYFFLLKALVIFSIMYSIINDSINYNLHFINVLMEVDSSKSVFKPLGNKKTSYTCGIIGGRGYVGGKLIQLLSDHPSINLG